MSKSWMWPTWVSINAACGTAPVSEISERWGKNPRLALSEVPAELMVVKAAALLSSFFLSFSVNLSYSHAKNEESPLFISDVN